MDNDQPDRGAVFLELLNEHEASVAAYVHSLVRDHAAAQDILQEARLTMWKSFDQFTIGTNFRAWARQVAFNKILTWRRRQKRAPLELSPETLEMIGVEIDRIDSENPHSAALRDCVKKLSRPHRQILLMRYSREAEIDEIAEKVGRSEGAVYRLLSRLRSSLHECIINHKLTTTT